MPISRLHAGTIHKKFSAGRIAAAVLMAASGLSVVGIEWAAADRAEPEEEVSPEVARQVDVRTRFGLNADLSHVTNVAGQPHLDMSYLGVPLTAAEVAELKRRDRVGESFARLESTLMSLLPASYGGVWIDQRAGGTAVIASTSPETIPIATVEGILPAGSEFRIVKVSVPLRRLNDLATRVVDDLSMWRKKGVEIGSGKGRFMENLFEVVLAEGSPQEHVEEIIAAYGAAGLVVTIGPSPVVGSHAGFVSRNATNGPLYGGQRIGVPEGDCTGTLSAVSNTRGRLWGVTAGHCTYQGNVFQGGPGGTWLGYGIGPDNGWFQGTSTNCDCTIFGFNNQGLPAGKATNQVIVNDGHLFTYGNWASRTENYPMGRRICVSAQNTDLVVCDAIRSLVDFYTGTRLGRTQTVTNQIRMHCSGFLGDSGAPAGDGPTWLGIAGGFTLNGARGLCGDPNRYTLVSRVQFLPAVAHATPNLPAQ